MGKVRTRLFILIASTLLFVAACASSVTSTAENIKITSQMVTGTVVLKQTQYIDGNAYYYLTIEYQDAQRRIEVTRKTYTDKFVGSHYPICSWVTEKNGLKTYRLIEYCY